MDTSNPCHTPKTTATLPIVTSTIDKNRQIHKELYANNHTQSDLESSLGLLSFNNVDLSNICSVSSATVDDILSQQRQLANSTLSRASKVGAIPSRLLKTNLGQSDSDTNVGLAESLISDSDILQTPKNTSTPRNSSNDVDFGFPVSSVSRESIFSKFIGRLNSDVSTHNAIEEFKQIAEASRASKSHIVSESFIPAEKAAARLMADEQAWKQKYGGPVAETMSFQEAKEVPTCSISIGEFFHKRSDVSLFRPSSPPKAEPVALIEPSVHINSIQDSITNYEESVNISSIQKMLSQKSGQEMMNYLLGQQYNTSQKKDGTDVLSLPCSQNASYTTSFSDNEAIKAVIKETNKENVKPQSANTQLLTMPPSSRSSSSLTNLPDGKLPIESTASDLVWGCIKIDRCATKQFILRNKTSKTLRLQCAVSTQDFKIRKDNRTDSDYLTNCKFLLHGNESRIIIISFIPTKMGPAVDELIFSPLDSHLTQTKKQCVRLWGYGGYSSVEFANASRDNTGKYWLSLGKLDNRVSMDQSFTVKNNGPLSAFLYIKIAPKHVTAFAGLQVRPDLFVLPANTERIVRVSYLPNAKDCRILKENLTVLPVVDIGKLEVISGTEVNRARLRRLNRKCKEKGLKVDTLVETLSQKINGEVFPMDVNKFKENPSALSDILETLCVDEMVVTMEQDANQTFVAECPEDSVIYQTLCDQSSTLANETIIHKSCHLEPPTIMFFPPSKVEDCLFLISQAKTTLHFDTSSVPNCLSVSPSKGVVKPGETVKIKIKLPKDSKGDNFKVVVALENEVLEAEIKILQLLKSTNNHFLG